MDKFTDNSSEGSADNPAQQGATEQSTDQSRRRFARGALAGGAVLLSLGNRAAWGTTPSPEAGCMSVMTLNSFDPDTGMFTSAPGPRPEHNSGLAARIHEVGGAPDYLGREGEWRTCQDPEDSSRVCLVKGSCNDSGPSDSSSGFAPLSFLR